MSSERNHMYLAERIYEIQNADWKQRRDWCLKGVKSWKIADDITVEKSEDLMVWYLWWTDNKHHYGDSPRWKCVPCHSSMEIAGIAAILKAQPWVYI